MSNNFYHITELYKITLALMFTWFLFVNVKPSPAQPSIPDEELRTRILFLLDASGSMNSKWNQLSNETRMYSAKRILTEIIDSLEKKKNVEIALRVYGHQSPVTLKNCKDTKLEVGFGVNSGSYIKSKLQTLNPKGITPISYSLEKAGGDFPNVKGRNIIILMTDGEESCGGNPCEVAGMLEKKNIVLKHFVIGIGIEESAQDLFDCIGTFFPVDDQVNLRNVLQMIITRILNKTTTQVDLLDKNLKPVETDVNMTFYNTYNKLPAYNLYHTLNPKGFPDTLLIDPVTDYDIVVHTIPVTTKPAINLTSDHHNHITLNTPQGYLEVLLQGKTLNNNLNDKIKCLVKLAGKMTAIHYQNFNTTEKYITGKYDLEILTLPRTYINNVDISQNKTTSIKLPTPGIANILKKYEVYGGIFIMSNNSLEKIYELNTDAKTETIALNPGSYFLLFRPKYSKTMHNSKTIEFNIQSGESISLNL